MSDATVVADVDQVVYFRTTADSGLGEGSAVDGGVGADLDVVFDNQRALLRKAQPPEADEAARAFGFHGWRLLVRIILPPVLLDAVPMLGNQMIQVIKDSAFLVIITVQELTYAANEVQATYYVPFASFICAILLYWLLCLGVEGGVRGLLRVAEIRR